MKQLLKMLNIQEGEGKPVIFLFAYFFFFGATLTIGKTARDTYFLNRFDISYLPLMLLAAAIAVNLVTITLNLVSKRFNLIHTITLSCFSFIISLIWIQSHLSGLLIPFLYVWIEVITTVISVQFWVYAGMVFNSRQAKRLFGLILCGSPIARIAIGASIPSFVGQFGSDYLLTLTAGFILCCLLMAWAVRPYYNQRSQVEQIQQASSKRPEFLDSYMKILALTISAAAVTTVIIEYQFLMLSRHSFPTEENLASFFGTFYSVTGFISLLTQLFLTRWILARFGILSAIRILPAGLGIGSLAILIHPSLFSALAARISEQITKFTLNKTSFELLWVPVSPDQKQSIKLFIDGTIRTGAQGLTGIFIYGLLNLWPLSFPVLMRILSLLALAAISIWIFATSYLKKGYISALMAAIEKRRIDFKQMRLDTTDSDIVMIIEDALNSDEEAKQIFALELISGLSLSPWSDTLNKLYNKTSPIVREKILEITTEHPDILSNSEIQKTIEKQESLASKALIVAGKRNMTELIPALTYLIENKHDQDMELRAAAATACLMMKQGPCDQAQSILEELLCDEEKPYKAIALRMLRHIPAFITDAQLQDCCTSDSLHICRAAMVIARSRYDENLISCIIHCLKAPQTRAEARNILKIYPAENVIDKLKQTLNDTELSLDSKIEVIRALEDYPESSTIDILVQMVRQPSVSIQAVSVDALFKIARQTPVPTESLQQLSNEGYNIARNIFSGYCMMAMLEEKSGALLLNDCYASSIEQLLPTLMKLLAIPVPEISIETYIANKTYQGTRQAENLMEIFENILPARESNYFIPLLQNISTEDRCRAGHRYFDDLPVDLDTELIQMIQSPNEYYRNIGLDYAIVQNRMEVLKQIDWTVLINQGSISEFLTNYVIRNPDTFMNLPGFPLHLFQGSFKELYMLSILEITIILKSTNLFEGVPGEDIYHVAQVMEEQRLEKGEILFKRGDKGDYLYIIVTGEILIHIDGTEFNRHGKGEYIGEMALLDDEPRSTSATALEETLLLKINQDNFLDIMMAHREVRKSIMKGINERFRRLTDRYANVP